MIFKIVYFFLCGVPIVGGVFYIFQEISNSRGSGNMFTGLLSIFGLAYLQIGLLNLLNLFYGASKPGIYIATVGINILSIGLILWTVWATRQWDAKLLFPLGVMTTMALMSLFSWRSAGQTRTGN